MADNEFWIRSNDVEAQEMLRILAAEDRRTMGYEAAWLIRQEFARRGLTLEKPEAEPAPAASR